MVKKQRKDLVRRTASREYRSVCWIGTEGTTERDYFSMTVFKRSPYAIKFPKDIHPNRRNPEAVLKRFKKALSGSNFRKGDLAWLVVDVDNYSEAELQLLLDWEKERSSYHVAISNPKFELFLVMHYEDGSGCTTPNAVDAALKKHLKQYKKRLSPSQYSASEINEACDRAEAKRRPCKRAMPDPGVTDVYQLVRHLKI